jgi:hypothetical protein
MFWCFDIRLTYAFAGFLMQTEEVEGTEGINDEEQPKGAGNDEGPSASHGGSDDAPDMVEGYQDIAGGDRDHEVGGGV